MSTQTATRDDAFMFDPGAETMSRDALTALQVERAKRTLEHAYAKVPLYRQRFDAAGVKPGDFNTLADIARFPFTLKSDLRDNYPFGMFAVPRDQVLRLHASSGTSGKPTVVGYSKADLDLWSDLMARSMACRSDGPGEHTEFRSPVECTTSEFISDIYLWSNAGRLQLMSSFSPTVSIESSTRWAYSCSRPARSEKSVRRTGLSSAESKSFLDREGITAPHPLFKVATHTLFAG